MGRLLNNGEQLWTRVRSSVTDFLMKANGGERQTEGQQG